ncbi:MAG: HAD family hydrolase [Clostridia bacterium]|nr:HAD family hydrolase [Clostridia bacterium]
MFENILFDLDGTLTDPEEGIVNSILHSLSYYPQIATPNKDTLRKFIGPPLADSYRCYCGMDEQTAIEAVEHYREYFRPKGIFENKPYYGIAGLLEKLRERGKRLIVATSKPEVFAEQILEHFGLVDYFDSVYGSVLDGTRVKKSDVIAHAMKENPGFTVSNTVMVGDTCFDVEGARENGLRAIGVCYGYGSKIELAEAGAFMTVKSVEELEAVLSAI